MNIKGSGHFEVNDYPRGRRVENFQIQLEILNIKWVFGSKPTMTILVFQGRPYSTVSQMGKLKLRAIKLLAQGNTGKKEWWYWNRTGMISAQDI